MEAFDLLCGCISVAADCEPDRDCIRDCIGLCVVQLVRVDPGEQINSLDDRSMRISAYLKERFCGDGAEDERNRVKFSQPVRDELAAEFGVTVGQADKFGNVMASQPAESEGGNRIKIGRKEGQKEDLAEDKTDEKGTRKEVLKDVTSGSEDTPPLCRSLMGPTAGSWLPWKATPGSVYEDLSGTFEINRESSARTYWMAVSLDTGAVDPEYFYSLRKEPHAKLRRQAGFSETGCFSGLVPEPGTVPLAC